MKLFNYNSRLTNFINYCQDLIWEYKSYAKEEENPETQEEIGFLEKLVFRSEYIKNRLMYLQSSTSKSDFDNKYILHQFAKCLRLDDMYYYKSSRAFNDKFLNVLEKCIKKQFSFKKVVEKDTNQVEPNLFISESVTKDKANDVENSLLLFDNNSSNYEQLTFEFA